MTVRDTRLRVLGCIILIQTKPNGQKMEQAWEQSLTGKTMITGQDPVLPLSLDNRARASFIPGLWGRTKFGPLEGGIHLRKKKHAF